MKVDKDCVFIPPDDLVIVTKMIHLVEIQHMQKMNTQAPIKKLDKYQYVDLRTGEVKKFELSDNRAGNFNSLRQTFKKLRYLINANFAGKPNELHVVLTYRQNMTDPEKLYDDFRKFMQRLKYRYKNESSIDYISVIEPQERGAWHSHLLLRFNDLDKVFIPNDEMYNLWQQGFTKVKSLRDVDNIGAYLSAYLADVELTKDNIVMFANSNHEIVTRNIDGQEKKFVKGGRLHLYPSGMNLFRKSKGIVYPERQKMQYKEVKKIVGSVEPTYSKTIFVEQNNFSNIISYEQYNLKRIKG